MATEQDITEEEQLKQEQERKYQFALFKIKTSMDIEDVKRAVMGRDFDDARDNSDFLWDLITDWHETRKMSNDDYIMEYVDYIYDWENDDGTNK